MDRRGTLNGIGVSRASTRDEVSDAAVLVALVVVHMPGEHHETGASVGWRSSSIFARCCSAARAECPPPNSFASEELV